MDDWVNLLVYHIGSGQALFTGALFMLAAMALSLRAPTRWLFLRNVFAFVGAILVAISGTPFAGWQYGLLGVGTMFWLAVEWRRAHLPPRRLYATRLVVVGLWLAAVSLELPYHLAPASSLPHRAVFFVIGDSVSAGMGEDRATTWPALLAQQHDVTVRDLSQMGATVQSAQRQAERMADEEGLVLLEIGGNDLLGVTSAEQFALGLEQLLAQVCRPGRTVVMLELPLPPFRNDFGRVQRRLAQQFRVALVPKRFLLSVLTTAGATRDGVHLSPAGHQLMADRVWRLIRGAYVEAVAAHTSVSSQTERYAFVASK